jgi:hypothetical protein
MINVGPRFVEGRRILEELECARNEKEEDTAGKEFSKCGEIDAFPFTWQHTLFLL